MSNSEQPQQPATNPEEGVVNEQDTAAAAESAEATNETGTDGANQALQQTIAELESALEAAKGEAEKQRDGALRAAAEAENVRRRAAQDVEKARSFALEKFAGELLPVVDNLERALQTMNKDDESQKSLIEGIEMTHQSFMSTIAKFGIEAVDPLDQPFNPEQHEAMGMQEREDVAPNTVISVMQKGYLLNGRLLRPAMVMVSRAATQGVDTQA